MQTETAIKNAAEIIAPKNGKNPNAKAKKRNATGPKNPAGTQSAAFVAACAVLSRDGTAKKAEKPTAAAVAASLGRVADDLADKRFTRVRATDAAGMTVTLAPLDYFRASVLRNRTLLGRFDFGSATAE